MCDLGVHERRLSCQCFQKGSLIGKGKRFLKLTPVRILTISKSPIEGTVA